MEDRHNLATPRLSKSSSSTLLVWNVDIYRKGVTDPVDTIEISDETLPPRLNKKGKVVWRLPTDGNRVPSFPVNEQRRIIELFKERKKNRKKKGSNKNLVSAGADTSVDAGTGNNGTNSTNTPSKSSASGKTQNGGGAGLGGSAGTVNTGKIKDGVTTNGNGTSTSTSGSNNSGDTGEKKNNDSLPLGLDDSNGGGSGSNPSSRSSSKSKKKKRREKKAQRRASTSPDDLGGSSSGGGGGSGQSATTASPEKKQSDSTTTTNEGSSQAQSTPSPLPPPPPGLNSSGTGPPGFRGSLSSMTIGDDDPPQNDGGSNPTNTNTNTNTNGQSFSSPMSANTQAQSGIKPPDPHTMSQSQSQQHTHTQQHIQQPHPSQQQQQQHPHQQQQQQPHPSMNPLPHQTLPQRYIIIPEKDRPNPTLISPKTSLAVSAAKAFVELYYPHITHGLSSDLATYYTPHAQKSISVGGAHSVVATRADIMLQLSKFSGSNFAVRGVVSQDTYDGKGAHVLVSGVVQTALNNGLTSFAHSISLVRKQNGLYSFPSGDLEYSFQIHNDALSLMTVSDMVSTEQQSQCI